MAVKIEMDMPETCWECRFCLHLYTETYCVLLEKNVSTIKDKPRDCPLKEIKE